MDSMTFLHTDADVLKVIDRISHLKVRDDLHIYLEHDMDVPELVQPPLPLSPLPLDTGCGEGLGEDLGEGLGEGLRDGQGEGSVLRDGQGEGSVLGDRLGEGLGDEQGEGLGDE